MHILKSLGFLILFPVSANCANLYFYTDSYRGRSDSPFLTYLKGGITYVEDFETQETQIPRSLLTTPNATAWNGFTLRNVNWGVQEDYSSQDPFGYRWADSGRSPDATKPPTGIHFDFTPDGQGRLPEYAGAALLGRVDPNATGLLYNSIFVYDKNGIEVTRGEWKFVRPPDVVIPVEDLFLNFYGIYVPGGISSIHFRDFQEVDHLTYGYAIPEPGTVWLAVGAGLCLLRRRR